MKAQKSTSWQATFFGKLVHSHGYSRPSWFPTPSSLVLAFYQLQLETKQPFPILFILSAYKMKLVENKTQIR